jgi:hypothetical protein
MLRSTLRKLGKRWGTSPRRSPRASARRPALEALEGRMVPSTLAFQFGSALFIEADPGLTLPKPGGRILQLARHILLEADQKDHSKLDVFDSGTLLGRFSIPSFNRVLVSVQGLDAIDVDDSNGFPFAPGTVISVLGTNGAPLNNSLNLFGSQAINGNETYTASPSPFFDGQTNSLSLGGSTFLLGPAIASVTDEVANNGELVVRATANSVTVTGQDGVTEQISGLFNILQGNGGGFGPVSFGTLTFRDKAFVTLQLENAFATTAALNATAAARGLKLFQVDPLGPANALTINAAPGNISTLIDMLGQQDQVNLLANSGPVSIFGNATDRVILGSNPADFSKSVTSGIQGNVFVQGGAFLEIADGGNVTTREQVTVTESTISGKGLFGNNSVVVRYRGTQPQFVTGRLANTYTVAGSHPGATFGNGITISDEFSGAGLSVQVNVDSASGLFLDLFNNDSATGSLSISAPGGVFNPFKPTPVNGTETVTFLGGHGRPFGRISKVVYTGFGSVAHS